MRSAPRALAPSHPLQVMPSRITRNSHRPRASDRTMVSSEATSPLAALLNSTASSPSAEKLTRMDNKAKLLQRSETTVGWISRKNLHSGRGGAFFLTSLFIELIDPVPSVASGLRPLNSEHRETQGAWPAATVSLRTMASAKKPQFGVHLAADYGPKRSNSEKLAGVASQLPRLGCTILLPQHGDRPQKPRPSKAWTGHPRS